MPAISVILISFNMAREIPRTVMSLLPPYQLDIGNSDIEVIVIENGSTRPVDQNEALEWPENVRYINITDASPSPAKALNYGVSQARGEWVCPIIDGARMISPGVFSKAMKAMKIFENPVIATVGLHLGNRKQQENVKFGYNQDVEDKLLDKINWPHDPYRLFEISCLAGSSKHGWLGIAESNVLVMRKKFYEDIGGYEEAFDLAGGGLVNLDFFNRCTQHSDSEYVLLAGEGSFHQFHGGVTTSKPITEEDLFVPGVITRDLYLDQYEKIRGKKFTVTKARPFLFGRNSEIAHVKFVDGVRRYILDTE